MITKEEMKAFFEQQVAEKGKVQMMAEALQWALQNKMISLEQLKVLPLKDQQIALLKLGKMYVRTLM